MKIAAQELTQVATAGANSDVATAAAAAAAAAADSERRRELLLFFASTFGVTWGIGALVLLIPDRVASLFGEFSTTSPLYFLAVYAPSLVALVLSVTRQGWRRGGELLAKLRPRKANVGYYVAVLLGWPVLNSLALLLQGAITVKPTPSPAFSHWYLAPVSLLVALVVDAGPLGEELGWRGYALPRLLSGRLSALAAALVLGVVWGVWHLPAFFVAGTVQHDNQLGIFWLILGTTLSSVIMTWLYRRTGGDVLASGLLVHLMNNMTSASLPFIDLAYAPVAIAAGIALTREQRAAKSEPA
jgi:membrane protease YdiL (CAAX protease family)